MISVRTNTIQQLNNGHVTPFKKQHQAGVVVLSPRLLNQNNGNNTPGSNGGSSSKYRRQQQQHQQLYKANGPIEQASPSHQLVKLHHQQQQHHQKIRFSPNPKSMHQHGGNMMSNNNHQHGNNNLNHQQPHRHSPYNNKGEKMASPQVNSESHFAASKFCTTPAPSTLPAPPEKWLTLGLKALTGTTSPRGTGSNEFLQALITPAKTGVGATSATVGGNENIWESLLAKIKPPSPSTVLMSLATPTTSHKVPSFPDDPAVLRIETGGGQVIPIGMHG